MKSRTSMEKKNNHSRDLRSKSQMGQSRCKTTKSSSYVTSMTVTPTRGKQRNFEQDSNAVSEASKRQCPNNLSKQGSQTLVPTESPSVGRSPETSPKPGVFYAGAKFSETPSPCTIPKPPIHWTSCTYMASAPWITPERVDSSIEMSNLLKRLLKV